MIPRREASKYDPAWNAMETIDLQITPCEQFCHANCFLGDQFEKLLEDYPLSSLQFYPFDLVSTYSIGILLYDYGITINTWSLIMLTLLFIIPLIHRRRVLFP